MAKKAKSKKKPAKRASTVKVVKKGAVQLAAVIPGEVILGEGEIVAFHGKQTVELAVANICDRPIQVGSHCHFFESNRTLRFDRKKAYGFRLQVPAGTAVRFEPGEEKRVTLVAIGAATDRHRGGVWSGHPIPTLGPSPSGAPALLTGGLTI